MSRHRRGVKGLSDGHVRSLAGTPSEALRLPTFLREYDEVAQHCAAEGVDFPHYLLRLTELELLDPERRGHGAAHPAGGV